MLKSAMRILQIVQKPQRRGAEVFAHSLSHELRRIGHWTRILYLYPHTDSPLPLSEFDQCLNGSEAHPSERYLTIHPGLLLRVREAIRESQPDIVQVNGARSVKYGALAKRFSSDARWKLIYRNIGDPSQWVRGGARKLFYSHVVIPQVDCVVGVSESTLEALGRLYELAIPTLCIPGGLDPALLQPRQDREITRRELGIPQDAPVAVFVGSLSTEKRVDRLLDAVAHLANPKLHVIIVGGGVEAERLQAQSSALAIDASVHFLGIRSNIADYLQASDFFVLPSDTEGLPGVLLEAGFLGLPSIATDVGGVSECIQDGVNGLVVPPTTSGVADGIRSLLDYPSNGLRMGANARDNSARFAIDHVAACYAGAYRDVLPHDH